MSERVANFGGVGSQNSPFSPGGSPEFRGEGSGGGYGVNDFSGDTSLDGIMSRTHKPNILGFERPIETMLESFHDDLEHDIEKYLLTFDERTKLNLKKKIRNKEQHLKDLANSAAVSKEVDEISKKLNSVESMLDEFRLNNDIDFSKNASYYRRRTSPSLMDEFLPDNEEYDDDANPLNMTKTRLTEPWTGITPHYEASDGVDKYIEQLNNPELIDMHAAFEGLMTYPDEQANLTHSVDSTLFPEQEGSKITPESKGTAKPLEDKLQALKAAPPGIGRLDPSMFYGLDWDEKIKGKYPERGTSSQTPWENSGFGDYSTTDYPDVSNNPYSSVGGLLH